MEKLDYNKFVRIRSSDNFGYVVESSEHKSTVLIQDNDINKKLLFEYPNKELITDNRAIVICKAKVISYKDSSILFGFKRFKSKMVYDTIKKENLLLEDKNNKKELYFEIISVDFEHIHKENNNKYSIVVLKTKIGNIKFLLSDIELILNIKGYNKKIDKTIKIGDVVVSTINNSQYKVINIHPNFSSRIMSKTCLNRKLDIIDMSDGKKMIKEYVKNLKKIINYDNIKKTVEEVEILPW